MFLLPSKFGYMNDVLYTMSAVSLLRLNSHLPSKVYQSWLICDNKLNQKTNSFIFTSWLTLIFRNDKQKIRELYYDTLKKRKELVDRHEVVVKMEKSIRKMKEVLDEKKKGEAKGDGIIKTESAIAGIEWDVEEMKKKVDSAKELMIQEKNQTEKEVKSQDERIKELEHQNKILYLKVKEKDKEVCLADLKIKELKRNLKYNSLKPLTSTPGNLTTRKINGRNKINVIKSLSKNRVNISGKRNSTDDYTKMSSNNGILKEHATTGSEVRLEKSESSLLSNDKNPPIINGPTKNRKQNRYDR